MNKQIEDFAVSKRDLFIFCPSCLETTFSLLFPLESGHFSLRASRSRGLTMQRSSIFAFGLAVTFFASVAWSQQPDARDAARGPIRANSGELCLWEEFRSDM